MKSFDKTSLKNVTLNYTTTHECYTSNYVKSNSDLNSPLIHNETTSNNFSITTYGEHVPPIDNER